MRKERLDDALMQEPPAKGAAAAAAKVGRQFGVHSADFEQRAEVAWRGRRRSPARPLAKPGVVNLRHRAHSMFTIAMANSQFCLLI